jgi:hypothetical protein
MQRRAMTKEDQGASAGVVLRNNVALIESVEARLVRVPLAQPTAFATIQTRLFGHSSHSKEHALSPDKVAPVVAWLASDASAAINGRIFWVEGGTVSHYEKWRIGHTITRDGRWDAAKIGPAFQAAGFEA